MAGSPKCKTDRILTPAKDGNGYLFVCLSKQGKEKHYSVHRLVLENFSPIENMDKLQVNHLDEDRQNNVLSNLEWTTRQENINYGNRAKKYIKTRGHKIRCIETGKEYESLREAERDTGCPHTHISECVRGLQETCHGFHWEYI